MKWKYLLLQYQYWGLSFLVFLSVVLSVELLNGKEAKGIEFAVVTGPPYHKIEKKPVIYAKKLPNYAKRTCLQSNGRYIPITSSCVCFAKEMVKYTKSVGNAVDWPRNTNTPVVGGVVIEDFKHHERGHVSVIIKIENDKITVKEANYISGQISERTLSINDSNIVGFWRNE